MSTHIKVLFTDRRKAPTFTTVAASEKVFRRVLEGRLNITLLKDHFQDLLGNPQAAIDAPLSAKLAKMIPDNLAIINRALEDWDKEAMHLTSFAIHDRFFIVALREPLSDTTWETLKSGATLFRGLSDNEVTIIKSLLNAFSKEREAWLNLYFRMLTEETGFTVTQCATNPGERIFDVSKP